MVDKHLRTSDERIYAAGDCIEVRRCADGASCCLPLGSLANRQGRAVGDNLGGVETTFGAVAGSAAVKCFETNVALTGLSESACQKAGIACESVSGTFTDKAHFYPDEKSITLKVVYEPETGKLLGLQAVGPGDVVKRVDVFGNLLHREGTLEDLLDLEFAYSPPYSPALDPLFAMGCAGLNQLRDGVRCVPGDQDYAGHTVLDVRTAAEAEARPLTAETIHIPIESLRAKLDDVPRDGKFLVVCARGPRSAEAVRLLHQSGREQAVYLGGGNFLRVKQETLREH